MPNQAPSGRYRPTPKGLLDAPVRRLRDKERQPEAQAEEWHAIERDVKMRARHEDDRPVPEVDTVRAQADPRPWLSAERSSREK